MAIIAEEVKPLEIKSRLTIYVFYSSYKQARQLERLGEVTYSSKKMKYLVLRIFEEALGDVCEKLDQSPFVKRYEVGKMQDLAADFSKAFWETEGLASDDNLDKDKK